MPMGEQVAVMEKPILFRAEMVRAILEGRKAMTRRLMRRQPDFMYRLTDEHLPVMLYRGLEANYGNSQANTNFTQLRLPGGFGWEGLLADAIQGIWEKGVRGLVSVSWARKQEKLFDCYIVSQEQEGDAIHSSVNLHGVSRNAPEEINAGKAFGRKSKQQRTEQFEMGNPRGELVRQESSRNNLDESKLQVYPTRERTYPLGDKKWIMQPDTRIESSRSNSIFNILDCPYETRGNLWVRETWAPNPDDDTAVVFRATDPGWDEEKTGLKWRAAIHLRRCDSRLTLEVVGVKVERVQDITEADAKAEGVEIPPSEPFPNMNRGDKMRAAFQTLWDSINVKKPGASWESNPFVWCVSFGVIKGG